MTMNMILALNLNDYPYSIRFEQALDSKQSLRFICAYLFSYKKSRSWLQRAGISPVCQSTS